MGKASEPLEWLEIREILRKKSIIFPDRVYYFNTATGRSQWERPDESAFGKVRKWQFLADFSLKITQNSWFFAFFHPKTPQKSIFFQGSELKSVQCLHLLVKHDGSRNPSSWRSDHITRSKDDAINILKSADLRNFREKSDFLARKTCFSCKKCQKNRIFANFLY